MLNSAFFPFDRMLRIRSNQCITYTDINIWKLCDEQLRLNITTLFLSFSTFFHNGKMAHFKEYAVKFTKNHIINIHTIRNPKSKQNSYNRTFSVEMEWTKSRRTAKKIWCPSWQQWVNEKICSHSVTEANNIWWWTSQKPYRETVKEGDTRRTSAKIHVHKF